MFSPPPNETAFPHPKAALVDRSNSLFPQRIGPTGGLEFTKNSYCPRGIARIMTPRASENLA
jgi:hypothetical protein